LTSTSAHSNCEHQWRRRLGPLDAADLFQMVTALRAITQLALRQEYCGINAELSTAGFTRLEMTRQLGSDGRASNTERKSVWMSSRRERCHARCFGIG
jgi:hypothetical protein